MVDGLESAQLRDIQDYRSKQHQLYLERSKRAYLATGATLQPSSAAGGGATSTTVKPPVVSQSHQPTWTTTTVSHTDSGSTNTTTYARSPLAPAQQPTVSYSGAPPARIVKSSTTYTTTGPTGGGGTLPQAYTSTTNPTTAAVSGVPPSWAPHAQSSQSSSATPPVVRKVISTTTRTTQNIPAAYQNLQPDTRSTIPTFVKDAELARKLQVEEDEKLARELQSQAESETTNIPSLLQGTAKPTPVPRMQNVASSRSHHPAEALGNSLRRDGLEAVTAAVRNPSLVRTTPQQPSTTQDLAAVEEEQMQRALLESRLEHERAQRRGGR